MKRMKFVVLSGMKFPLALLRGSVVLLRLRIKKFESWTRANKVSQRSRQVFLCILYT